MRLIDADALHKAYMELRNFKQDPHSGDWISSRAVPLTTVIRMLNEAPTIEPKHGEWIVDEEQGTSTCSACGIVWQFTDGTNGSDFCPNCGAKMDGERREL